MNMYGHQGVSLLAYAWRRRRVESAGFSTTALIHFGMSAVPACGRQATTRGPTDFGGQPGIRQKQ